MTSTQLQKTGTQTQKHGANILGVKVTPTDMHRALDTIDDWIRTRSPHYVCVTPAHSIMECHHIPSLRPIFNASGMTTPDGMSVVWLLKLMGHKNVTRVYGPDLMREVCRRSAASTGYRHFLYGGAPGVPEKLANALQSSYPGLKVAGTYSPPFRPLTEQEDQAVIDMINASKADIVWVGISTPKQEMWMSEHRGKVNAPVMIGVGAAFDFLSGSKRQAPLWMQRSGLEWLFRLATEPRRLWRRYIQYPYFGYLVLQQLLGIRRYPVD